MTRKRAAKPQSYVRERKVPVQVYVYEREREDLRALERERGLSASELIRLWIKRARSAGKSPQPTAADPRQLRLAE